MTERLISGFKKDGRIQIQSRLTNRFQAAMIVFNQANRSRRYISKMVKIKL